MRAEKYEGRGLRQLINNVIQSLATRVGSTTLAVGLAIVRGRHLGAEEFGAFHVAVLAPIFLVMLLNMGVGAANTYFVARGAASVKGALRSCLTIWACLCPLGLALGGVVFVWRGEVWFPGAPASALWLGLALFPAELLRSYFMSLLLGVEDIRWYNRSILVYSLSLLAWTAVFFAAGTGLWGAVAAHIAGTLTGAAVCGWRLVSHGRYTWRPAPLSGRPPPNQQRPNPHWAGTRDYLKYGWKANVGWFLNFINYRADIFLVNLYLGGGAAGAYAAAVLLAEKLWLLPQSVGNVLMPRLSALHGLAPCAAQRPSQSQPPDSKSRSKIWADQPRMLTPLFCRWTLAITAVAALLLGVFSSPLFTWILGRDFADAGAALCWLLPGVVAAGVTRVLTSDLAARGRVDLNMATSALLAAVNITANVCLIPWLGLIGAALASTMAFVARMALVLLLYGRIAAKSGQGGWRDCVTPAAEDWRLLQRAVGAMMAPRRAVR